MSSNDDYTIIFPLLSAWGTAIEKMEERIEGGGNLLGAMEKVRIEFKALKAAQKKFPDLFNEAVEGAVSFQNYKIGTALSNLNEEAPSHPKQRHDRLYFLMETLALKIPQMEQRI